MTWHNIITSIRDDYANTMNVAPPAPRNTELSIMEAQLYELLPENTHASDVAQSYQSLIDDIIKQFISLMDTGFHVHGCDGDPYSTSKNMYEDVFRGMICYRKTITPTRNDAHGVSNYPMMDIIDSPYGFFVINDVFRIVHDVFGHFCGKNSFGIHGEYQSWIDHRTMMSPRSLLALYLETRGQNVVFNYGTQMFPPHVERTQETLLTPGDDLYIPAPLRTHVTPRFPRIPDILL